MAGSDFLGLGVIVVGVGLVAVGGYLLLSKQQQQPAGGASDDHGSIPDEHKPPGLDGEMMTTTDMMMPMMDNMMPMPRPVPPDKNGNCPKGFEKTDLHFFLNCVPVARPALKPSVKALCDMMPQLKLGENPYRLGTEFFHTQGGFKGFPRPHRKGNVNGKLNIGIVKPTFTAAAYNDAFYSFYSHVGHKFQQQLAMEHMKGIWRKFDCTKSGQNMPCMPLFTAQVDPVSASFATGTIPASTDENWTTDWSGMRIHGVHPASQGGYGAYTMLMHVPAITKAAGPGATVSVIDDRTVDAAPSGAALLSMFDVLVLGHQEYVTAKEYANFKNYVASGGTLLCMDGNLFYAEVKFIPPNKVLFVDGHGITYNPQTQMAGNAEFEKWFEETRGWLGSNFNRPGFAYACDKKTFTAVGTTNKYTPFGPQVAGEEQIIDGPENLGGINIINDYGAIYGFFKRMLIGGSTGWQPIWKKPIIATYQKPFGLGQSIVMGLYTDYVFRPGANPGAFSMFLDQLFSKTVLL
jgi:hypothetical protein